MTPYLIVGTALGIALLALARPSLALAHQLARIAGWA